MSKTYARNRPTRQTHQSSGRFVVGFAAFLFGYLAASVFDIASLTAWVNKNVVNRGAATAPVSVAAKPVEAPKPKFEFYTLLSRDNHATGPGARHVAAPKAAIPVASTTPAAATTPAPTNSAVQAVARQATQVVAVAESKPVAVADKTKGSWQIQVASFNRREDAEQVKASLVMRGFDVGVVPVTQRNMTWYRVIIGPFVSRDDAAKAQAVVARSERMQGMIRHVAG